MTMIVVMGKPAKVKKIHDCDAVCHEIPFKTNRENQRVPLRRSRLATNFAKSKLVRNRTLYKIMHQKLKVLKMALIRRDVASDMAACEINVINTLEAS